MKKLILLIVALSIFALSACTSTQSVSNEVNLKCPEKYGYYSIVNVAWGMSLNECIKSMNFKKSDFKKETISDEGDATIYLYTADIKLYEKDAIIGFVFSENDDINEYETGLKEIRVVFKDKVSLEFFTKQFEEEIQQKKLAYKKLDGYPILSYQNEKNINSIGDEQVKSKATEIANKMYPDNKLSPNERSLDKVQIILNPTDSSIINQITYSGKFAAIVSYADKEINK